MFLFEGLFISFVVNPPYASIVPFLISSFINFLIVFCLSSTKVPATSNSILPCSSFITCCFFAPFLILGLVVDLFSPFGCPNFLNATKHRTARIAYTIYDVELVIALYVN